MDRSTSFISLSIVLAGVIVAGAIVFTQRPPRYQSDFPPFPPSEPLSGHAMEDSPGPDFKATPSNDPIAPPSQKTFSFQRVRFSYPNTWSLQQENSSAWSILDGTKRIGTLTCPIPEIGFQAWDFSQGVQRRMFKKEGQEMRAELWLAPPRTPSTGLDWIARLTASEKDPRDPASMDLTKGCMIRFQVSNPPTEAERSILQEVYQGIQ